MNKLSSLISITILLIILSACGIRERILSPPDVFTVPKGSLVAECTKDDNIHRFIYKDDGVYQYFINDIEQDQSSIDYLIEQAYLNGSSVENYLGVEYPNLCIFSLYEEKENNE